MTLSMRNMDDERGAVLTQSAKVCTHSVQRPPFWLIVTALDCNRYLPVNTVPVTTKAPANYFSWHPTYFIQISTTKPVASGTQPYKY